jgi:hypothetical protein
MTERRPIYSYYKSLGWQCHIEGCGCLFEAEDAIKAHIRSDHKPPYRDVYGRDIHGEQMMRKGE